MLDQPVLNASIGVASGESLAEQVKQGALPGSNGFVQLRDAPHDEAPGDVLAFLLRAESGGGNLGDFRVGYPLPGRVVEDRVGVFDGVGGFKRLLQQELFDQFDRFHEL